MNIIQNFENIKEELSSANYNPKIIAVSKTFPLKHIQPLLDFGHRVFGENRVQEAQIKWELPRAKFNDLELHLIGALQRNKAKDAIKLFDYIHSLDSQKLADALAKHQANLNKSLNYFIQVNIGNEIQKSGIPVSELDPFYNYCKNEINLNILGLMVIPPNDNNPEKYFKSLNELNKSLALKDLSMGMSADYIEAIRNGATFIRVGSSIFGERS